MNEEQFVNLDSSNFPSIPNKRIDSTINGLKLVDSKADIVPTFENNSTIDWSAGPKPVNINEYIDDPVKIIDHNKHRRMITISKNKKKNRWKRKHKR